MTQVLRNSIVLSIAISGVFFASRLTGQDESANKFRRSSSEISELARAAELLETDPLGTLDVLENYLKDNSKTFNFEYQSRVYHLTGKANFKLSQVDLAISNYLRALDRGSSSYKQKRNIALKELPLGIPGLWIQCLLAD